MSDPETCLHGRTCEEECDECDAVFGSLIYAMVKELEAVDPDELPTDTSEAAQS